VFARPEIENNFRCWFGLFFFKLLPKSARSKPVGLRAPIEAQFFHRSRTAEPWPAIAFYSERQRRHSALELTGRGLNARYGRNGQGVVFFKYGGLRLIKNIDFLHFLARRIYTIAFCKLYEEFDRCYEETMQFRRCTNITCRRPYRILRGDINMAKQGAGRLDCPHCGRVEALWEDDVFSAQALTVEQEAVFDMCFPADRPASTRLVNI
jgi:hypothetical protein